MVFGCGTQWERPASRYWGDGFDEDPGGQITEQSASPGSHEYGNRELLGRSRHLDGRRRGPRRAT